MSLDLRIIIVDAKDGPICMLLPVAIKAPKLRANERRVPVNANKRRKEESSEEKAEKQTIRETFVIHVEVQTCSILVNNVSATTKIIFSLIAVCRRTRRVHCEKNQRVLHLQSDCDACDSYCWQSIASRGLLLDGGWKIAIQSSYSRRSCNSVGSVFLRSAFNISAGDAVSLATGSESSSEALHERRENDNNFEQNHRQSGERSQY